jgi:8-oxo-dGTP diphosphatase
VSAGPRVGAIVACLDDTGRILVVKQITGSFAGAWLLPGGTVDPGERVEDCARRELYEETGYAVADLTLVARYDVRSAAAGGFHVLLHMYRGEGLRGAPRPEPESEVRWLGPREVEWHPAMAVQLVDLAFIDRDRADLDRGLARIGVEVKRLR